MSGCIFCKIVDGNDPDTTLLYEDDSCVVFKDHKPGAPHHYLAIPKEHIRDAKHLTHEHLDLVEKLELAGKKVLVEAGGDIENARLGFHWPPVVFVPHVHLHILAPISEMSFFSRMIYPSNALWFSSVEWLKNRLMYMKENISVKEIDSPRNVDLDAAISNDTNGRSSTSLNQSIHLNATTNLCNTTATNSDNTACADSVTNSDNTVCLDAATK